MNVTYVLTSTTLQLHTCIQFLHKAIVFSSFYKYKYFNRVYRSRSVPYNMRIPNEAGDWDCPECGNMNYARRTKCNGKGGKSCPVSLR